MMLTKMHEMQLQTKLENFENTLPLNIQSDSKSFYAYEEVSRMFEIRLDHWRTMLGI